MRRSGVRLAIVTAGLAVSAVATTGTAMARPRDAAPGQHYSSLGLTNTILLFVVLPLGIFFFVAGLAALPSYITERRRRANLAPWDYSPIWIGGPANPRGVIAAEDAAAAAAHEATTERLARAATAAALTPVPEDASELVDAADGSPVKTAVGGASAEW